MPQRQLGLVQRMMSQILDEVVEMDSNSANDFRDHASERTLHRHLLGNRRSYSAVAHSKQDLLPLLRQVRIKEVLEIFVNGSYKLGN